MTNKLMYFIGNWKMFGDFNSFKIINKINKFNLRNKALSKKIKIILCVPNTLIYPFRKKLKNNLPDAYKLGKIEKWVDKRPEELSPDEFIQIYNMIFVG